jgi:uncharacterized protein YdeI (YjbR/CyaY-like superfamily)
MGGPKKTSAASRWREESDALREILLGCGLHEDFKWRSLCYSHEGKNIAIIQEMKAFLALMFFKGALLKDLEGVLKSPGPNSNHARRFEFVSLQDILASKATLGRYAREAIEIEEAGLKVTRTSDPVWPDELLARFERDPSFKAAFEALTPGRQRGYTIYFSAPKGAEARERRINKCAPKILDGKGLQDR